MLVIICYNYFGMYLVKYYHQEVCMGPSVNQDCWYLINAHVIENIWYFVEILFFHKLNIFLMTPPKSMTNDGPNHLVIQ